MPRIKFGEMRNHWAEFIWQFPFHWWVSLTSKVPLPQSPGRDRILEWVRQLCVEEGMQVAFIAVENEFSHRAHWHLLMLGRNRFGRDLSSVDKKKWAKRWWKTNCSPRIKVKKGALIKDVEEIVGVSSYLARNLVVKNPDASDLFIYNKKLLKRSTRRSPIA